MSIIQISCIVVLLLIVIAANVVCFAFLRGDDWEETPPPLIAFTIVADLVILVFVLLGAMGVLG